MDYSPLVARPHRGRRTIPLVLPAPDRAQARAAIQGVQAEHRVALRAQALLMMADGVAAADVAVVLGVHERTVFRWRKRFACENPSAKLADAPRSGRPPSAGPKSSPPSTVETASSDPSS
jgi:hypothetical protein